MKVCPVCSRVYPDDAGFCPADGTALKSASTMPPQMTDDPRVGKRLAGRYELRRVVADGGMGRVYEGIDKQTNTRVAVKVLHPEVAKDEVSLERFKREYEISSRLPHDHIVKVLDFRRDEELGIWLLVMEYLDGEELRYLLKRLGTLSPGRLVRMLSQSAIGLDEAHARQLVHRDLKPDNIFLCGTREGDAVKVLDFGSVKDKRDGAKKLTQLGTTIGSPFYMAPEQAQGLDTLDARADVWAMGAIAYECVTGTVPFEGNNGPSILLAILTKDPAPPSEKAAGREEPPPPAFDYVIEEALAKNQNIRTKSVGALADAVGRAYGLDGNHKDWAYTPQNVLEERIAAARPRVMGGGPKAVETVGDPFAAPAGSGAGGMASGGMLPGGMAPGGMAPGGMQPGGGMVPVGSRNMDRAFELSREADLSIAGVPKAAPKWLVPAILGGVVLVLLLIVVALATR